MDAEECLQKGLLKKEKPDREKAGASIEAAKKKLKKAKELTKVNILDMAEVNAYSAMFHAARALLFRDGIKERSHFAVYVYIKEKYGNQIEPRFLNELNVLRMNRHEIFYGFDEPDLNGEEVRNVIILVESFIGLIKKMLH